MCVSSPNTAAAAPVIGLLTIRSLCVVARLDPAALPRDILPPPGRPAGEVFWQVRLGSRQQAILVRLSGKTYRRILRDAETLTTPMVAVFQATFQLLPQSPWPGFENAGLRLEPKGAGGATSAICQSHGPGQPVAMSIPWLEASVSVGGRDLPDGPRFQLGLGTNEIAVQLADGAVRPTSRADAVVLRGRLTASAAGFELLDSKLSLRGEAAPAIASPQVPAAAAEPEPDPAPEPVRPPVPAPEPARAAQPPPEAPAPAVAPVEAQPSPVPAVASVEAPAQPDAGQAEPPVRAPKRVLIPTAVPAQPPEPAPVAAPRARRVRRPRPVQAAPPVPPSPAPEKPALQPEPQRGPRRASRGRRVAPDEYDFEAAIGEIVSEEVGRALTPFLKDLEALAARLGLRRVVSNTAGVSQRRRGEG